MSGLGLLALAASGLYEQSIAKVLSERFVDPRVSYMVMDIASLEVFAIRWDAPGDAIPPGSVVKPFLAVLASPRAEFICRRNECWASRSHGRIHVQEAIANSCNSWFLQFTPALSPEAVQRLAMKYGLPEPPRERKGLIGLAGEWRIAPAALLGAFAALATAPEARIVRSGMALSARSGTGRLVSADCLIKTGTAPCTHAKLAPGDGLAACIFPARTPRYVLLVRVHGTTGSVTARTAGEIIRSFRAP